MRVFGHPRRCSSPPNSAPCSSSVHSSRHRRCCGWRAAVTGIPVLVLPGFTAGDRSTMPLRWFLRSQGWWAHGWHLGPNFGPTRRVVTGIQERLDELHGLHGRTVSIVGWSLGGIYARELARRKPELVRQVITLGSPFRMVDGDRSWASGMYETLSPAHRAELLRIAEQRGGP